MESDEERLELRRMIAEEFRKKVIAVAEKLDSDVRDNEEDDSDAVDLENSRKAEN